MNDKWKAFWCGVLAAIGTAFGLIAVLRRRTTPVVVETPEKIASDAKEKIDAVRIDVKNDSDQALADRFNALAKKQTRKVDER